MATPSADYQPLPNPSQPIDPVVPPQTTSTSSPPSAAGGLLIVFGGFIFVIFLIVAIIAGSIYLRYWLAKTFYKKIVKDANKEIEEEKIKTT